MAHAVGARLDGRVMATVPTRHLLEIVAGETRRLTDRYESQRAALMDTERELLELRGKRKELEEALELRRYTIAKRWAMRQTLRELRSEVLRMAPMAFPARAGGVKMLMRTRAMELADAMWKKAAPIHKSVCKPGVYALFQGNELVYIGQAVNILNRVGQHASQKDFTHVAYISAPMEQLNQLERALLDLYAPRLNRDGSTMLLRKRMSHNVRAKRGA